MTNTAAATKIRHQHFCSAATGKNARQDAPGAGCVSMCSTETLTARQVRTFKSHPGQVRVTWSNGGMTWEAAETA